MDVKVGLWRKLSAKELMLLNCGVREDLRVPWTARRSNQSILKEISPGISLEGMILKLKLQYFGHLMWSVDSLEKTLMPGGWDGWMASLTRWTWVWVNSGSWWWTGRPGVLQFMGWQRAVRHDWETELNWTLSQHHLLNSFPTERCWCHCQTPAYHRGIRWPIFESWFCFISVSAILLNERSNKCASVFFFNPLANGGE